MVLLVEKFRSLKFPSRLDHPTHDDEALSASLRAFRSDVSKILSQFLNQVKPGSDFLTLVWYEKCFEVIPLVERAFATLMMKIDYPMEKWDSDAADEYLNYSLDVLDLLNRVSSSLSDLGQARLSLAHGLNLFENNSPSLGSKYLIPIKPKHLSKELKLSGGGQGNYQDDKKFGSWKDMIVREAFLIMRNTGILILGFLISGLCCNGNPYLEVRNSAGEFVDPLLKNLDSVFGKQISENRVMVKEVKEVNTAATGMVQVHHGAAEELRRRLEVLERLLKNLEKKTDNLFSGILAARNKLLGSIRNMQKK